MTPVRLLPCLAYPTLIPIAEWKKQTAVFIGLIVCKIICLQSTYGPGAKTVFVGDTFHSKGLCHGKYFGRKLQFLVIVSHILSRHLLTINF